MTKYDFETEKEIFIFRTFVDNADREYVAARLLAEHRLDIQFLWSAMHAIEKYLKSILLFNDVSTVENSHNINSIYKKVLLHSYYQFHLKDEVIEFITDLEERGNNRYFNESTEIRRHDLFYLDKAVWEIRRYCLMPSDKMSDVYKSYLIKDYDIHVCYKFNQIRRKEVFNTYIDELLLKDDYKKRVSLVYQNAFFTKKARKKFWTLGRSARNSHKFIFEVSDELKFWIASNVKNYFDKDTKNKILNTSHSEES